MQHEESIWTPRLARLFAALGLLALEEEDPAFRRDHAEAAYARHGQVSPGANRA